VTLSNQYINMQTNTTKDMHHYMNWYASQGA
jgi:hypothetical protein